MNPADFAVSDLRMSTINRVSLRPMIELDDERLTADQKSAYVKSIVTGKEKSLIYMIRKQGNTVTPLPQIAVEITPNDPLARIFFSLQVSFKPLESMEAIEDA